MCITQVTGALDFNAEQPEKLTQIKKVMEQRRKELKAHLKTLDAEMARLAKAEQYHNAKDVVRLHEVNKR